MAYEQRPNSGSLFPNDRKEKETHPDLTGTIDVDGVAYWINGWSKTSAGGKEFISLSVRLKDKQPGAATTSSLSKWAQPAKPAGTPPADTGRSEPAPAKSTDGVDEDVPF
jgi:uncharacterized protein (DUF736 family)